MNTEMNKRRLATMDRIEAEFFRLVQHKSLKEISVADLCERAEINRSTFYANYNDLNALAAAWCRKIEKQVAELPHEDGDYAWLFEYVHANKEVFSVYFKLAMPPEAKDYQSAFRRRGIYAVVKAWFENGCREYTTHMGNLLNRLMR